VARWPRPPADRRGSRSSTMPPHVSTAFVSPSGRPGPARGGAEWRGPSVRGRPLTPELIDHAGARTSFGIGEASEGHDWETVGGRRPDVVRGHAADTTRARACRGGTYPPTASTRWGRPGVAVGGRGLLLRAGAPAVDGSSCWPGCCTPTASRAPPACRGPRARARLMDRCLAPSSSVHPSPAATAPTTAAPAMAAGLDPERFARSSSSRRPVRCRRAGQRGIEW